MMQKNLLHTDVLQYFTAIVITIIIITIIITSSWSLSSKKSSSSCICCRQRQRPASVASFVLCNSSINVRRQADGQNMKRTKQTKLTLKNVKWMLFEIIHPSNSAPPFPVGWSGKYPLPGFSLSSPSTSSFSSSSSSSSLLMPSSSLSASPSSSTKCLFSLGAN